MCRSRRLFLMALALLAATTIVPVPVLAEPFVDLYAGGAFPLDSDTTYSGPTSSAIANEEYKIAYVGGVRAGYYFEVSPRLGIGLALDASYFNADLNSPDGVKNRVVPTSLLLLVRYQLARSEEFRLGRFQPYFGFGPSVVWSRSRTGSSNDDSIDPGIDLRLGLTCMLTQTIGLFGEYRFLHVKPDYNVNDVNVSRTYDVNFVTAGVTFRF